MKISKSQHFEVNYSCTMCDFKIYTGVSEDQRSFDGPEQILTNYSFESLLFLVS